MPKLHPRLSRRGRSGALSLLVPLGLVMALGPATPTSAAPGDRGARTFGGNRVTHVTSGIKARRDILRDLAVAEREICFETYMLSGSPGRAVAEVLAERARAGVGVQVTLHKSQAEPALVALLQTAGADVRFFDKRLLRLGFVKRLIAVDHVKLTVIDRRIAWAGGVNFDGDLNRDLMTRIEGPAVEGFLEVFHQGRERWREVPRRLGRAMREFVTGAPRARAFADPRAPRPGQAHITVTRSHALDHSTHDHIVRMVDRLKRGDGLDLWMMDLSDHALLDAMERAIRERGVRIRAIVDPTNYFGPTGGVTNTATHALRVTVRAAGRPAFQLTVEPSARVVTCPAFPCELTLEATGQTVTLRHAKEHAHFTKGALQVRQPSFLERLAEGVPDVYGIYRLQKMGAQAHVYVAPPGTTQLHAKVYLFHKRTKGAGKTLSAFCGSTNAIASAFLNNRELAFHLSGGNSCQPIQKAFERDLRHHSRPAEKVDPRGVGPRLKFLLVRAVTKGLI
ncbi:MAG: hypothetical protein IT371_07810 [Deltaproteobacteria bacterium]|nr:hypothetical protein [Deltaproteobacteria bacterium]